MTSLPSSQPGSFWAFERSGWEQVATGYHEHFSRLTVQAVGPLLDAVGARPGVRLLDAATGPGYVAAAATQRGASTIGLDFAVAMAAHASRHLPEANFGVGDAEQLPFQNGSFDAVVMNFGLLHLERPEQALGEAHRVLRSGGRAAFTVWAKPERAVAFGLILRAIEAHGNLNPPLPSGPPFFRFSDPEEFCRVLDAAGFVQPEVKEVRQQWQLPSPDHLLAAMVKGTVRTGALLHAQSPEALKAIRAAIRETAQAYEKDGGIELPMPAILAFAMKA